jgi:hypothetical protein
MPGKNSELPATETGGHSWLNGLRVFAIWAAVIIGCLSLSSYVLVRWLERQILTTENWVTLVSPIPKQPVVASALGGYISSQVFDSTNVQQKITEALPPQAGFLAGPLSSQLQTLTTRASTSLVASDGFQSVWSGANRIAMARLLATARGTTPPLQQRVNDRFNINISDAAPKLRGALGKAAGVFPALQPATEKTLQVTTDLKSRPRRIHQVIRMTDTLYKILPLVTSAAFLIALALSWRRRRTLLISAATIFLLMLLELIALKWLRQETLAQVKNPDNTAAVTYIYDTFLKGLKDRIYVLLAVVAVIWALCLAAGPARWAVTMRSRIFPERLRKNRVSSLIYATREWIRHYQYYLWLGVLAVVLGSMAAFLTITGHVVVNALLLIISLCALLYIIATPHKPLATIR